MSPDSLHPSRQRRAWRFMAALGPLLGASALFLGAVKWQSTDQQVTANAEAGAKSVCAVIAYAERNANNVYQSIDKVPPEQRPARLAAAQGLERLAADMRATGIDCPPDGK